jgi:dihydroorotase
VNPPLRTPEDVAACVAALLDGTIDCIATDHAPHATQDKLCEFDHAAFGISGLETALALTLTAVPLETAIERLAIAPVRTLGLDARIPGLGSLAVGAPADVTLIDPSAEWTVEPELLASKGKNTPLAGRTLRGKLMTTITSGKVVWRA